MANRRSSPLSSYYRRSPSLNSDKESPLPFLATITDSATITMIVVPDGYVLITPQDGTVTITMVPSGTDSLTDSGTATFTVVPTLVSEAFSDSGTATIVIINEGRLYVGYLTTKQDGQYNVTII